MKPKLILYIAMSLDGYIATTDDKIDFLNCVQKEGEDYGYTAFTQGVDTIIMGRKTYDKILTLVPVFPHQNKECYIITRTPRASIGKIHFYTGDLKELLSRLKAKPGKDIYLDGGAEIVNALLKEELIDEMYISIIPILLGKGLPLFSSDRPDSKLKLVNCKSFEKGLVQLHYAITKK